MATYAPNQLHSAPLAELQPDPAQPRKYLAPLALEELTASVKQNGIIGKPPGHHLALPLAQQAPQGDPGRVPQGPAVPKIVLIEIAKRKRERSMVNRDQQAKTAAPAD